MVNRLFKAFKGLATTGDCWVWWLEQWRSYVPTPQNSFWLITARKRSLGQGNVFTPVYQSFCSQGRGGDVCLWLWGSLLLSPRGVFLWVRRGVHPLDTHPSPQTHTSLKPPSWTPTLVTPPPTQTPLPRRDGHLKRAVRILLECILVAHKFHNLQIGKREFQTRLHPRLWKIYLNE